jgi:hypothetical protein
VLAGPKIIAMQARILHPEPPADAAVFPRIRAPLRRALGIALLACVGALAGCATPEIICDMKTDYTHVTPPARTGKVSLSWSFVPDQELPCKSNSYGCTECFDTVSGRVCDVRLKRSAGFQDVCGLAKQMHELNHVLGMTHEN